MKIVSLLSISTLALCAITSANACTPGQELFDHNRVGIQGSLTTGGNVGLGLVDYTNTTEIGFNIAARIYNSSIGNATEIVPAVFGGFRKELSQRTYATLGLDVAANIFRQGGEHTTGWFAGPYIGIEQMLANNIMLTGWIDPYSYSHQETLYETVTTHRILATGGIAFSYLLN